MDLTIVYAIGVVAITLGLPIVINYLRRKKIINTTVDDILFIVTMFNLSMEVIDELNLKQEPMIKKIGNILSMTMDYIAQNYQDGIDMHNIALNYALNLANEFNLEITSQRKEIIIKLIDIGLQTKF